ncbi:putative nepenthesin [Lupinus albus]|uniref:Putative nepenthesin n=1 Tax=Lupinus albus TaxID=3870 RepID=A0A6A4NRA6_LUPAL|nr:putative nepenthesin [Lupinus albus]
MAYSCSFTLLSQSRIIVFLSLLVFCMLISASPKSLMLKRVFPNYGMELSGLREMDMKRHGRMLLNSSVVTLPVNGTSDPTLAGLYYTTMHLGSPPREFHVDIDTGSDIPWVNCISCSGCPRTTGLPEMHFVSTTTIVALKCITWKRDQCCSNLHTGKLTSPITALDGIFGFGNHEMSFISQLHSQGVAPNVFSHCLKGDDSGGGLLVLGEAVEPNMVYSPLIPKQLHYDLNLESITVKGQMLQIDPEVFKTSSGKGATIDSGTTLAYFIEEAYYPIIDAITRTIPQSVGTTDKNGFRCYLGIFSHSLNNSFFSSVISVTHIFPPIGLNFANHASLVLRP